MDTILSSYRTELQICNYAWRMESTKSYRYPIETSRLLPEFLIWFFLLTDHFLPNIIKSSSRKQLSCLTSLCVVQTFQTFSLREEFTFVDHLFAQHPISELETILFIYLL